MAKPKSRGTIITRAPHPTQPFLSPVVDFFGVSPPKYGSSQRDSRGKKDLPELLTIYEIIQDRLFSFIIANRITTKTTGNFLCIVWLALIVVW